MWFFDKMKELDNSSGRTDKKKGGMAQINQE